jgi:predicted nucleotidyltransferase
MSWVRTSAPQSSPSPPGTASSGFDLLIEAGPRTPPWFPGGLLLDLEEELGRRVDIAEESTLHPLIRDRVLHEAIPL